MRITINLATRPFADLGPILKRLRIAMVVFAVVSVGLGVGLYLLHHKAEQARARNHSLDGNIARVTHERQGYEDMMRQPDNAKVLNEANTLNQIFDEKAFSWTLAMEDLETVLPRGVQVTTLEPLRDKEGRITLRLRVVGPRDANVGLLKNLEHSKFFLHPTIVGESMENSEGPGEKLEPVSASNKVNFDLLAEYNAAALAVPAPKAEKTEEDHPSPAASHPAGTGLAHSASGPATARPATASAVKTGAAPANAAMSATASKAAAPPAHPAATGIQRPPVTGASHPPAAAPLPVNKSPYVQHQSGARRYPNVPEPQPAPQHNPGGL